MESLLSLVLQLSTTGGIIYLIVERFFPTRGEKAKAKTIEISNDNSIADLYNRIDEIVQKKITAETRRICEELTEVKKELKEIKSHWCCYREECAERILYKRRDYQVLKSIEDESKGHICKK